MNYFQSDPRSAYDAKSEAQRIAFAPMVFQACRLLRDSGILELVQQSRTEGISLAEVTAKIRLSRYGIKILMEAGLGIGLFYLQADRYILTRLGYFILRDPMTRINMDVVHEVCYRGMFHLADSIEQGKPVGLKTLGNWPTFYEGLSSLTPAARESWLAFDHFYSDAAFPAALRLVFENSPKRLLDVGGNTGKWAMACARFNADVHVTIADLPQQLSLARQAVEAEQLSDRIDFWPLDLLVESTPLPKGHDAIWMSQFLDCFSQEQIISILRRAGHVMTNENRLYILELCWDRQPNETAAFCLQQTSLYFACIANGNSQMYHSEDLRRCIKESGLEVVAEHDQVGNYHTLFACRKAD